MKLNPIKDTDFDVELKEINNVLKRVYKTGWYAYLPGNYQSAIYYIKSGVVSMTLNNKKIKLHGETIFIKDKEDDIFLKNLSGEDIKFYVVTFNFREEFTFKEHGFNNRIKVEDPDKMEFLYSELLSAFDSKKTAYKIKCKSLLYSLIYMLIKSDYQKFLSETDYKISKTVEYINKNLANEITMEKLSKISNYSISHMRKLFNSYFNMSPVNYINSKRLNKAKEILENENLPIEVVATMVGFKNISYFIRAFKKLYNITPRQYKEEARKVIPLK